MSRTLSVFLPVLLPVLLCVLAPSSAVAGAGCLLPPVPGPVVEPFRMPACEYCSGRRGVGFAPPQGTAVVASAAGRVTFVGIVAGTRYVVVRHDDGLRATYGGLATLDATVQVGARLVDGAPIGTSSTRLYFGLRREGSGVTAVDPTPWLGRWRYRSRLLPGDGGVPRRAPAPRLACPNG